MEKFAKHFAVGPRPDCGSHGLEVEHLRWPKLKELLVLINIATNNIEFENYENYYCSDEFKYYILESTKDIPDDIKNREKYKIEPIKKLKKLSYSVVRCFKQACDYYNSQLI